MLLGGRSLDADAALAAGITDGTVAGDVTRAAVTLARELLARDVGPRPSALRREGLADPVGNIAMVRAARAAARSDRRSVAEAIVGCVEAALVLPFAQGLAFEAEAYAAAEADPQSRALRHLVLAERRAGAAVFGRTPEGGRAVTRTARRAAERLLEAMTRAAGRLARDHGSAAVDGALVAVGFDEGPFGGREAAAHRALWRPVLAAAVAEGYRMIEEGLLSGSDAVDLAAVHAGGFARLTGGPMWAGRAMGLDWLTAEIEARATTDPGGGWTVPAAMAAAAAARTGD